MFSLESPQRGDSNEYIQYTIPQYKKIILNYSKSAPMGFVSRTQGVQNSRGKRAISVRTIEVLLYSVIGLTVVPNSDYHNTISFGEIPITILLLLTVLHYNGCCCFVLHPR